MVIQLQLYEYYQFVMACLESDSCVTVVKANKEWPKAIQIKTQYYLALSHVSYFQLLHTIYVMLM